MWKTIFFMWVGLLLCGFAGVTSAQQSEIILPETTRGFLSIPDMDDLREKWDSTQLGELMLDPIMQPFVTDLKRQINSKLSQTGIRLGITWADLDGIYGGEICVAVIQPDDDPDQHALVMVVDVTGHEAAAIGLLKKVVRNQERKGATKSIESMAGVDVTVLTIADEFSENQQRSVFYTMTSNRLVVTDHQAEIQGILQRLNGATSPTLADVEAFSVSMAKAAWGDRTGEIRWFVEPFGYAEASRAANRRSQQSLKTDLIAVLSNQGFREAIRGIGGQIFLATNERDIVHRTLVFAPDGTDSENESSDTDSGFKLAARILNFPNRQTLKHTWVPSATATMMTLSWKMADAFEHAKSLINELIGSEEDQDLFEEVIGGLATDPDGPRVNIRTEIIQHFADRVTIISEPKLPVTVKSEWLMAMIELEDVDPVVKAINRLMESDPDARKHVVGDAIVWEMVPAQPPVEVPNLDIFDPFAAEDAPKPSDEDDENKVAVPKNWSITVANNHLIVANNKEYIVRFLERESGDLDLAATADFQAVQGSLAGLGTANNAMEFFTRTDVAYRTTYELLREGKMPESETMFGKLLNGLLTDEDDNELRSQQIDGAKLPPFQEVAKYLGPAGAFMQTVENGWFSSGCLVRQVKVVAQADASSVSEETNRSEQSLR